MEDSIKAGCDIGDETERQAAAEARRREIMEQIRQLEQEKAKCQGIKIALGGMKERLIGVIFQINSQKVEKLEVDTRRFSGVASTTETQIGLLDSYIAELAEKISILKAGL